VRLRLYGRPYCHLCDEMVLALGSLRDELRFSVEVFDVDADPDLESRYGDLVPVLTDETGIEICHYHLDESALRGALGAAQGDGGAMR
jgi:thiol-disulfide isomerase/thioredoxin